jgi:hypothetical protein
MVATIRNPIVHCQSNSRKGRNRVNVPYYNQFSIDCLFVRIKKKAKKNDFDSYKGIISLK